MTLNQVVKRVSTIANAHKQIRNFYFGNAVEFLTVKKTRYTSCFLQDTGIGYDINAKTRTLNFKMYFLDLVHVATETKANEQDVLSDMLSVAEDLISEFNQSQYSDWKVSTGVTGTFVTESLDDMVAGAVLDITIITPFDSNVCVVPTDEIDIPVNEPDMKLVYDEKYVADGTEGTTLSVSAVVGKKILLITRENNPLFKVSSSPNTSEFAWNDTVITLNASVPARAGERFLILYRNY